MTPFVYACIMLLTQRPDRLFERIVFTIEPVVTQATDTPLRKVHKELFNERLAGAKRTLFAPILINAWFIGPPRWRQLYDFLPQLGLAGADLADDDETRLKWLTFRVAALRYLEHYVRTTVETGSEPPQGWDFVKAARIDAEIDLLKLKESLKDKK